jgi:hypothetical protein
VLIRGQVDVPQLLEQAQRIAQREGIPGGVAIGLATEGYLSLHLPEAAPEQAWRLLKGLAQAAHLNPRAVTVTPNALTPRVFRDYFIDEINIEGPDQSQSVAENVPASTTFGELAAAFIHQNSDSATTSEGTHAVVDVVDPQSGATRRQRPESTLHDGNIQNGDTVHIAHQARAAGINPLLREEALTRVLIQVLAYADAHDPDFQVSYNAVHAPTEYLFRIHAPGWGPPPGGGTGNPSPVDEHEVLLLMPADFPVKAPEAYWQSPVFHPNIDLKTGKVCLGVLETGWRPAMDFAELCQMLVEIAGYQNYSLENGYNTDALKWARSEEGQAAIVARGGESKLQVLARESLQAVQGFSHLQFRPRAL